jgi:hypothetical protein
MKNINRVITRRDFIRGTVGATLGLSLVGPGLFKGIKDEKGRSLVLIVRDKNVMNDALEVNKKVLGKMLERALTGVTGENSIKDAWLSLISPKDIVGLVPTPFMNPTHDELMELVTGSLVEAGVPPENIRDAQGRSVDLEPITALISLPGLKAHWLTGIGTVIKNYILYSGAPRNYHKENSAKLGEIWNLPQVKGKTRLILVDALHPVCDKGPQVDPRYRWAYNGLIAGTDPVAVEEICLRIIQTKREDLRGEPWPLSPPPICIEAAEKIYKLGTRDIKKIDIKTIGWSEGLLI